MHRILLPLSICVVGMVTVFFQLGSYRTLGSHEAYVAVPTREMLSSGDLIVPRFGGLPRLEKPPLSYWVAAASVRIFGEISEWTLRFPSALSAILLAALIGFWARRWYGSAAGWGAAISQLTAIYVLIYARKAEVDMLLCLLTTAAIYLVAMQMPNEPRARSFIRWTGIYTLLGLTWLAKFHYGTAMVLAPVCIYFGFRQEYRRFRDLLNPVGLALFAAAIIVWPWLLMQQIPEAMALWKAETVGRATGGLGHQPLWYFVIPILWMVLPWTPYALAAAVPSWRRAWPKDLSGANDSFRSRVLRGDSREQFLWIWFLTNLAIVSLSADKHRHYIMAGLPMISLLAGQRFALLAKWVGEGRSLLNPKWVTPITVASMVGALGAILGVLYGLPNLPTAPIIFVATTAAAGTSIAVWLFSTRRTIPATYVMMLMFTVCYVVVNGSIMRHGDHRLPFGGFAREIRSGDIEKNAEIVAYRLGYHSMVYYVEPPIVRSESLADIHRRLAAGKPIYVLTFEPRLAELATIGHYEHRRVLDVAAAYDAMTRFPMCVVELRPPQVEPEEPVSPSGPARRLASMPQSDSASQ